ncbi:MAG: FG-GAP repeat protein, partial [Myxococcota bacterium]
GVAVGRAGQIAWFAAADLGPSTPFATATWSSPGLSAFADLGAGFALGDPGRGTVWLVPAAAGAPADPSDLALGSFGDSEGESNAYGTAVAAGDWDGDGVRDLAVGDPSGRDGEGLVYVEIDPLGGGSTDVQLRGESGGLGVTLGLGPLDGSGVDGLIACRSSQCERVDGGQSVDDRDVSEVSSGTIDGTGPAARPHLVDLDRDGAGDLVLAAQGEAAVWFGPLPTGATSTASADWRVSGAVGDATGAGGSLWAGLPGAAEVRSFDGTDTVAADGTVLYAGGAGSGFGGSLTDPGIVQGPDQVAIAAPDASPNGAASGEILGVTAP